MTTFDVPTENLLVEVCCARRVSSHYGDGAVIHFYSKWSSQPASSASTRRPRRDINFGDSLRPPLTMISTIAEENRTLCMSKEIISVRPEVAFPSLLYRCSGRCISPKPKAQLATCFHTLSKDHLSEADPGGPMHLADTPFHLWLNLGLHIKVCSLGDLTLVLKLDYWYCTNDASFTRSTISGYRHETEEHFSFLIPQL